MLNTSIRGLFIAFLFALILSPAPARAESPFCSDPGCKATRQTFQQLCDYIVAEKVAVPTIYVGGYYMRTLVHGYEILGDHRYLDTAIAYADGLLKKQLPRGYWATGYGTVYLADTGSALGLFAVLYKHVDRERQKQYLDAVQRYVDSLPKDGMILPNGALGGGWGHAQDGKLSDPSRGEYTISSALTGGEIYTWMYYLTKDDKYRRVAYDALRWIFSTMRKDGVIPYVCVLPTEGASLEKQGDPANDFRLWDELPYLTSAYVGEGLLSFDLHCNQSAWKAELRKEVKPHIEWLLATQNPNGTWGKLHGPETECRGKFDVTRSPGIANFLIWYYENVHQDPRIVKEVQAFDRFLVNPANAKAFGLLNAGAAFDNKCANSDTGTSLTGPAIADILAPGITSKW